MILLIIAAAVSAISITVTISAFFKPLRTFLEKRSRFLGKLFSCPYCFSHYISFVFALFIVDNIISFVIVSFALVTFSSFFSIINLYFLDQLEK